ncbi:tagatose-6-phosphate kinase, partial [Staphylococcus pseudintermedius]
AYRADQVLAPEALIRQVLSYWTSYALQDKTCFFDVIHVAAIKNVLEVERFEW